jgi:hypothetical protein
LSGILPTVRDRKKDSGQARKTDIRNCGRYHRVYNLSKNMIPKNGDKSNAETIAINKRGRANEIVQKFRSTEVVRVIPLLQSGSAVFAYTSADIAAQIFST